MKCCLSLASEFLLECFWVQSKLLSTAKMSSAKLHLSKKIVWLTAEDTLYDQEYLGHRLVSHEFRLKRFHTAPEARSGVVSSERFRRQRTLEKKKKIFLQFYRNVKTYSKFSNFSNVNTAAL